MPRYVVFGSELIEIYPTPSGLHSFIPNIDSMTELSLLLKQINEMLEQVIDQNRRVIEILEKIEANTSKGKPPK